MVTIPDEIFNFEIIQSLIQFVLQMDYTMRSHSILFISTMD